MLQWFPSLCGIVAAQGEDAKMAATELLVEGLVLLEDIFKNCSKGKTFFGGDIIGYLDIALGCFLGWLRVTDKMNNVTLIHESKTPCLYKWAEDFCADSAVKDVMPETDKLADAAKVITAKTRTQGSRYENVVLMHLLKEKGLTYPTNKLDHRFPCFPSNLHVLSMLPAFILGQDRTVHEIHSCITYSFLVHRQSGFGIVFHSKA
ncbi:Glutathione S-transferase U17 [Capsicum baccatum]|uniref:glutathione transferase n=1 Tax=Capsicum baccatum TaxID=33114 RepID=A0A2G2VM35_CAPBA|nr:Glutathione S-transferase U17 [Capsicum baccatum]